MHHDASLMRRAASRACLPTMRASVSIAVAQRSSIARTAAFAHRAVMYGLG